MVKSFLRLLLRAILFIPSSCYLLLGQAAVPVSFLPSSPVECLAPAFGPFRRIILLLASPRRQGLNFLPESSGRALAV